MELNKMIKNKKNLGLILLFLFFFFFLFITPASAEFFNTSSNQSDLNWQVYTTTPVNLANTIGYHWINWTWDAGTGRIPPSSWNVSWNNDSTSGWSNDTVDTFYNQSTFHWVNISVWGWNSTDGTLSETAASGQQLINEAPVITNTSDWLGDEGSLVYLDFNYTDADGDNCTFSTNATEGYLNTTNGTFEWIPGMADQGTYFWNFTVSDSYGGEDFYVANITVNDLFHPDITDWWNNYTSNSLTHFTIVVGDNRTVFFNVTSNQSGMMWYWYKDGDLVQSGSQANYTATWDVGGIDKEIRVYGSNPNGNTESLYWIIYIEYTAHEIEWLKYLEMQEHTEAEKMLSTTVLFGFFGVLGFVFFLLGLFRIAEEYFMDIILIFASGVVFLLLGYQCYISDALLEFEFASLLLIVMSVIIFIFGIIRIIDVAISEFGYGDREEDRGADYEYK